MNLIRFFTSLLSIMNEMSPYILLGFIIAGFLHVFVKPETMARHLSGVGFKSSLKAALLGIPLPLCSCGVLPTAVSLRRQGASKGAVTSFLIATPQTGVDSIAATYSLLGLPFAIIRPLGALVGAVFGGMLVGWHGNMENAGDCDAKISNPVLSGYHIENGRFSVWQKIIESFRYGLVDMVASVGKWLVIGLVVAALITVLIPDELFLNLSKYPILAMLVMVIVSVPMYVCATGSIPIALSLMCKGLTPGVGFVLLMAGPAANFASMLILSKSLGRKSSYIYLASVVLTAIIFGLVIDYIFPRDWFAPSTNYFNTSCHSNGFGLFESLCSLILISLLAYSVFRQVGSRHLNKHRVSNEVENYHKMRKVYIIEGMSCQHCQSSVKKAISSVAGVDKVIVDLSSGEAAVEGDFDENRICDAIYKSGFSIKE